jgi:hypothetical protein
MSVVFTANYSFSGRQRSREALLMTDFVNLRIKSAHSFRDVHRYMMYMCIFIGVNVHTCMSICVCTMFFLNYLISSTIHGDGSILISWLLIFFFWRKSPKYACCGVLHLVFACVSWVTIGTCIDVLNQGSPKVVQCFDLDRKSSLKLT